VCCYGGKCNYLFQTSVYHNFAEVQGLLFYSRIGLERNDEYVRKICLGSPSKRSLGKIISFLLLSLCLRMWSYTTPIPLVREQYRAVAVDSVIPFFKEQDIRNAFCILNTPCLDYSGNFGRVIVGWHRINWWHIVSLDASKMRLYGLELKISYARLKNSFAQTNFARHAPL
jgi:hypothetical protein